MDDVSNIKARLPIEQLVASYCQLTKKGRNFAALCPFHNDSKPSLLVSPDKGIAYCFACQTGGDIFSFYQAIEGCDFPQAIRELADRAGVKLEEKSGFHGPKKDEKQRARECLEAALSFYRAQLSSSPQAREYLRSRAVPQEQIDRFEIGVAPDSFSATFEHLLKAGFNRREILAAGLGVQRELQEEKIYDRFRHRLLFPIHDAQGQLIGFGGRTLADDDAKYINSSDGILFHKSNVLYALHHAKEKIRETKTVVLVEGYFDVLACHQVGVTNAVATCGTALTDQHVKLLRRYAERVTLCLDQDRAGQDAMERAFPLLCGEGLHVQAVVLPGKDPSETLQADPSMLEHLLQNTASPYLDIVLEQMRSLDLASPIARKMALARLLSLLGALPSAVERTDYLRKAAVAFQTTETALEEDLLKQRRASAPVPVGHAKPRAPRPEKSNDDFSAVEVALGIFLFYPKLLHLLSELIPPPDGMAAALYAALKNFPPPQTLSVEALDLPDEHRARVSILHMFCEYHGFAEWSEALAIREIRHNCIGANREMMRAKQQEITRKLIEARAGGRATEELELQNQYEQILRLQRKVS